MTDNSRDLWIFRKPEDMPRFPDPKDDSFSRIFRQGRTGIGLPVTLGLTLLMTSVVYNHFKGYPRFSRLWQHAGSYALGYWLGGNIDYYQTRILSERDAMMAHYISLHPEDFVEQPAPKLKYVIYPWYPVRESNEFLKDFPLWK